MKNATGSTRAAQRLLWTGFKSLSKAKILDGHEIWGPLALADGKLILRDQTQVKCIDLQVQ